MDWTSRRFRLFSLFFGGLFLLLSCLNIYRLAARSRSIWWTPADLAMPLVETRAAFNLRINGVPMEDLLKSRALRVANPGAEGVPTDASVRVRLNHENAVLAARIPAITASATGAGAALVMLPLVISPSLSRRATP
jgi:hypothetical protein